MPLTHKDLLRIRKELETNQRETVEIDGVKCFLFENKVWEILEEFDSSDTSMMESCFSYFHAWVNWFRIWYGRTSHDKL